MNQTHSITPLPSVTTPIAIPTLLIGLGGIGSHTVAAVYRKLKPNSQAPLGAIAIDADPYTLSEITDCPTVALRGNKTLKEAYESLPIEEKEAMFESTDAIDAPAYRDFASERPIYLRKNAYLVYRAVQFDQRLRQLTEALKHFLNENPCIFILRVYFVCSTFGRLGSALLQPIARELSDFLSERISRTELRAFLLPPDHIPYHTITPDCHTEMLSRSFALMKEIALLHNETNNSPKRRLLAFSDGEAKPLFSQIILTSTSNDPMGMRFQSARFEAALCDELVQPPRFTQEMAYRKLSSARIRAPKTELYERLIGQAINAYRKFPTYVNFRTNANIANEPDTASGFFDRLDRVIIAATETDAEKALTDALTAPPMPKPRFLHKRADTAKLIEALDQHCDRINAAVWHYLDFNPHDSRALFCAAIDELLSGENCDSLTSLRIMRDSNTYASPASAERALRRLCHETSQRLYAIESAPFSPKEITPSRDDTPYYAYLLLRESLSELRDRVIEAKRNALRCVAYRYLESRLVTLLDRYRAQFERLLTLSPLHFNESTLPDCYTVELNDDEISYEAVKNAVFSHLDHTLGRAFYTDAQNPESLLDCRDALREHPAFSALFHTSILERIYREDPESFPKRFAEIVRKLPHTREHTLASVILNENEVAFLERYQDTVMPPEMNLYDQRPYPRPDPVSFFFEACGIAPTDTVILSGTAYQDEIGIVYATPFVAETDYPHLTPNETDRLAKEAYDCLKNATPVQRMIKDPHLFASLNQINE